jgi:hypothetical protein
MGAYRICESVLVLRIALEVLKRIEMLELAEV